MVRRAGPVKGRWELPPPTGDFGRYDHREADGWGSLGRAKAPAEPGSELGTRG